MGSAGHSMRTTAVRSPRLPTAAPMVSSRWLGGATCLLVKKPLDGVEDRVLVGPGLGRGRGGSRLRGAQVLAHAIVLLPALERIVEVDHLPLRVTVLDQPAHLTRHGLGESTDIVA